MGLGVGGRRVVGGDVDHIRRVARRLRHRRHVVRVRECEPLHRVAVLLQIASICVHWYTEFGSAEQYKRPTVCASGNSSLSMGGLLVERRQVRRAGDVAAHGARPVFDLQRGGVVRHGGAQHGHVGRGRSRRLQRRRRVREDQVHPLRQKAVDDRRAVGRVARGVALGEGHGVAQRVGQGVLKALRGGVQRVVLHQLADAHRVGGAFGRAGAGGSADALGRAFGRGALLRGLRLRRALASHAPRQRKRQRARGHSGRKPFHPHTEILPRAPRPCGLQRACYVFYSSKV